MPVSRDQLQFPVVVPVNIQQHCRQFQLCLLSFHCVEIRQPQDLPVRLWLCSVIDFHQCISCRKKPLCCLIGIKALRFLSFDMIRRNVRQSNALRSVDKDVEIFNALCL